MNTDLLQVSRSCVEGGAANGIIGIIFTTLVSLTIVFGYLGRSIAPPFPRVVVVGKNGAEVRNVFFSFVVAGVSMGSNLYNAIHSCGGLSGPLKSIPLLNLLRASFAALSALMSLALAFKRWQYSRYFGAGLLDITYIHRFWFTFLFGIVGFAFIGPLCVFLAIDMNRYDPENIYQIPIWIHVVFWLSFIVITLVIVSVAERTSMVDLPWPSKAFVLPTIFAGLIFPIYVELIMSLTLRTFLVVPEDIQKGMWLFIGFAAQHILPLF
ncbi:hypothetical protein T439DRAFT_358580 [Meredithblackwellia eburnea MCA 4105]